MLLPTLRGARPTYQRCHIELTAGKKGQNPLPDWPVMAETSLKSDIFLNQWIQIEIEWLRTPSNFCNLPVRPNQIHGNFQSRTDTRGIDYDICTQARSEEHTSELQSRGHLVCRLL